MDPKSSEWRPGPTVCRCCFAEGCYKDISTEYFWMGKREVYSEMLSETFDVSIAFSKSGGPNSNSRLICEPCIARLRDASDFKRQVQECERTFMQHLDPGRLPVDIEETAESDKEVKLERVKVEKRHSDDDDDAFDDRQFADNDNDDDDDLDDQPLTKLASKVPKKESVDILDLLDNAKVTVKRKSTSKAKAVPAKKAKTKKEASKPSVSKTQVKPEKKKKDNSEMAIARQNAKIIVTFTTAYPFKLPESSMVCVYCYESFDDPSLYREHMRKEHQTFNINTAFAHVPQGYIKLDCTELSCRICGDTFQDLNPMTEHLINAHNQAINLNHDLGIQIFKIYKDKMYCTVCSAKYTCLRSLSRHTQTHYGKYPCETCGKAFNTPMSLWGHLRRNHMRQWLCKCRKTLHSRQEEKEHLLTSPDCWRHLCECGERFMTWELKQVHLREVHGESKNHPCTECDEVFDHIRKYRLHFRLEHTNNHFMCSSCGKKFITKGGLQKHVVVHTKVKLFPCEVCSKLFSTKSGLTQHTWMHNEVKRFSCMPCKKQFNQRVSWKTHMRRYHPELVDFEDGSKSLQKS